MLCGVVILLGCYRWLLKVIVSLLKCVSLLVLVRVSGVVICICWLFSVC